VFENISERQMSKEMCLEFHLLKVSLCAVNIFAQLSSCMYTLCLLRYLFVSMMLQ